MELGTLEKEVASARQLITDITRAGNDIYDCLAHESALKEARQAAIAKQTDRADVEQAIQVPIARPAVRVRQAPPRAHPMVAPRCRRRSSSWWRARRACRAA